MPTKLKGLKITSTDLVDQGANPDAHIRLFKRRNENDDDPDGEKQTFLQKFAAAIGNAYRECAPNTVAKEAQMFTDYIFAEQMRDLTREAYGYCDALMDSLRSIIIDSEISSGDKLGMMNQSVNQFAAAIKAAIPKWATGKSAVTADNIAKEDPAPESNTEPNGVNKSTTNTEEETDNMKFNKSKMTPEDIQTLEDLEKRYGIADDPAPAEPPAPAEDVNKSAAPEPKPAPAPEMHPEVKKALEDMEAIKKAQLAEIEDLKKSLEMEKLTTFAKKYEIIGKNADELAAKLYELKKAGGTVYADYVALLDENVNMVEKGGLFTAIGSDNSGSSDTIGKLNAAAGAIAKSANTGMTPDSIVKAFESNPELAAAYEAEYKNGGK